MGCTGLAGAAARPGGRAGVLRGLFAGTMGCWPGMPADGRSASARSGEIVPWPKAGARLRPSAVASAGAARRANRAASPCLGFMIFGRSMCCFPGVLPGSRGKGAARARTLPRQIRWTPSLRGTAPPANEGAPAQARPSEQEFTVRPSSEVAGAQHRLRRATARPRRSARRAAGQEQGEPWGRRKPEGAGCGQVLEVGGAGEESRTPDLRITNALLYQLSYTGTARQYSVRVQDGAPGARRPQRGAAGSSAWYRVTCSTSFLEPRITLTRS